MDRKTVVLYASYAIAFAGTLIIVRAVDKRAAEREIQEELTRKAKFAHVNDQLDLINDDLQRRINIAQKALLDDDFNQIIKNL